ncbi:TIR domain-containing protein [Sulfobacillus sp. hq2]|uniref:TIR domain-containing protein n=1 Tax=Sulfobacillus TaxID=28033 RepID=UPI000CD063AC|nr:TIR domain-containing protein [Sulfobacillus sp. hq2]POB10228.1 molecular chaperone Tir [Sulfobacillus sp. hq2]
MAKRYNLFISHSWTYSDAYDKMIALLKKDPAFHYHNFSVPKDDPVHDAKNDKELYEAIKAQIRPSSVVLILAGVYSTYSKWINNEILICQTEFTIEKPIVAIQPWGSEKTSTIVKNAADKLVKWQSKSIIDAIKELCD